MHVSNNRCIDPTALARMQPRSQVIDRVKSQLPAPSLLSKFSSGTSQSSKNTSAIGDVRTPIFSSFRATFIPGESFSTRKALIPFGPRVLSTVAKTTSRSATGPLVTKILLPLRKYLEPFLTAVVARLNASEPLLGSLMALPPMSVPLQRPGKYFFFCASVPLERTGITAVHRCALMEKSRPLSLQA